MSDTAVAVESDAPAGLAVRTQKRYGWRPDHPDMRDYLAAVEPLKTLPPEASLRDQMPAIYDQGQLGSCTANSIGAILEFNELKQGEKDATTPSRLFIYYNERTMEGTVDQDSGAEIRDGIKSVAQLGAPPETDWPYDVSQFAVQPPPNAYTDAKQDLVSSYKRVAQSLPQMQGCLADGYPFVFGFTCYDSFESDEVAKTGVLGMPKQNEQVVGGHAVMAVGYSNTTRTFLIRNSWGRSWGQSGYFTIPYEYLLDSHLASDDSHGERIDQARRGRWTERRRPSRPHSQYWTIAVKESGLRLAPPTRAPSISASPRSAVALSGLTLPP